MSAGSTPAMAYARRAVSATGGWSRSGMWAMPAGLVRSAEARRQTPGMGAATGPADRGAEEGAGPPAGGAGPAQVDQIAVGGSDAEVLGHHGREGDLSAGHGGGDEEAVDVAGQAPGVEHGLPGGAGDQLEVGQLGGGGDGQFGDAHDGGQRRTHADAGNSPGRR